MVALTKFGCESTWFSNKSNVAEIEHDKVYGYIFNKPTTALFSLIKGRHWFPVIKVNAQFYNMDSKLANPVLILNFNEFIESNVKEGNTLLLITKK
uniref:Ubiquitinyl hydrolase 1 n=1 Tax=Rhabditophanes sp. KR3021 TaxID=114890 RepID=A0AC35TQ92_9BILA